MTDCHHPKDIICEIALEINSPIYLLSNPSARMRRQCFLQQDGCTVLVTGGLDDDLHDVVNAAHQEWQWLRDKERVATFGEHR